MQRKQSRLQLRLKRSKTQLRQSRRTRGLLKKKLLQTRRQPMQSLRRTDQNASLLAIGMARTVQIAASVQRNSVRPTLHLEASGMMLAQAHHLVVTSSAQVGEYQSPGIRM